MAASSPPPAGLGTMIRAWFDYKAKTTTIADARGVAARGVAKVKDVYARQGLSMAFLREITKRGM